MHRYEFKFKDDVITTLESRHHISDLKAVNINGAHMIIFDDADDTAVNLRHVKEMAIDGNVYAVE